jgi:hypothetical protein
MFYKYIDDRRQLDEPGNELSLNDIWKATLAGRWWHTPFILALGRQRQPLILALGRQRQADFWVRGQPGLQSEFQDSQGYTEKPCLEKPKKKKKKKKKKLILCLVSEDVQPPSCNFISQLRNSSTLGGKHGTVCMDSVHMAGDFKSLPPAQAALK